MKTARIQWLLDHVGELQGDDLKEAKELAEREHDGYWVEMSDEEPVPYDRDVRSFTPPDNSGRDVDSVVNIPPSTRMVDPQADILIDDMLIRIKQLEAVTTDLLAKLKALEERVL